MTGGDWARVVALVAAGAAVARLLEAALGDVLRHPSLARANRRGRVLPTAAGLALVVAVVAVSAVDTLVGDDRATPVLVVTAVVAFGLLGLVDDLLGDREGTGGDRGLAGHLRAAAQGRLTTGAVKLGAGAAVAVVLGGAASGGGIGRTLVDGAVVALAANLANLLDRAPGRTTKVAVVAAVPLLATAGAATALAPVVGAALGLLPGDLRERFMLGDTGANALGAAVGTAVVLGASATGRTVVAAVLVALTLLSEVVSFSRVIDRVAPLRALDRLGRLPEAR